jgi:hypothetical protein
MLRTPLVRSTFRRVAQLAQHRQHRLTFIDARVGQHGELRRFGHQPKDDGHEDVRLVRLVKKARERHAQCLVSLKNTLLQRGNELVDSGICVLIDS